MTFDLHMDYMDVITLHYNCVPIAMCHFDMNITIIKIIRAKSKTKKQKINHL